MNVLLGELRGVCRHGLAIIDCALERLERQAYRNVLGHDFDTRANSVQLFGAEESSEVEAQEEVHEPAATVDDSPKPQGRAAEPRKSTSELLYTAAKLIDTFISDGEARPSLIDDLRERAAAFKALENTP